MKTRNAQKGLTLVELLAVIAIVAILATIAVTSYRGYLVRARLQDAKVALETVRAEEEQFRAEFGYYSAPNTLTYFGGTGSPAGGSGGVGAATVDVGDYRISFPARTNTTYTVRGNPNTSRQQIGGSSKYGGWIEIDEDGDRDSEARNNAWP
jgi:type IV pilus assembly protein PilE